MAENPKSPQRPGRAGKGGPCLDRLDAIAPLLSVARTEELIAARAAELGVSSRTLHRWIAAYEGALPGSTKIRFDFPTAALFIAAGHFAGDSIRTIHQALQSRWEMLYPGKRCPCLTTIRCYVRSLSPLISEKKGEEVRA